MSQKMTLHTFRGESFQVAVRKDPATEKVSVAVLPSEGKQWAQLMLFEFECQSAEEAVELSHLLKSAAAIASHIEERGPGAVEFWTGEAALRRPV